MACDAARDHGALRRFYRDPLRNHDVFTTALRAPRFERQTILDGIATGKTRVVDLSYAINDKLVPWPRDKKWFEAKTNATVEKDGYFTRSFWMLEHYGTHLDAPIHFPPGKTEVDKFPAKKLFGPAVMIDVRARRAKRRGLPVDGGARRRVGEEARPDPGGRDRITPDRMGFAMAGCRDV